LNCLLFCFLIEFSFYLPTTNGWFWFLFLTIDGRDGNPLRFGSIYRIMSFITVLDGCFNSLKDSVLDGCFNSLKDSVAFIFYFLISPIFPFPNRIKINK
jgi:hypothetical protein